MLDLRDAMLQADALLRPSGGAGGSANYCRTWEVFALRGMGSAALDTNDTGDLTVVESSSMPPACPALPVPATVTITATDSAAAEAGLDTGTFTVSRSGDTARALTVHLAAPAGSAVSGADYLPLPATVTIAEGAASAQMSSLLARTPLNRLGTAEEIASVAVFLCSKGASYVTGCDIRVDGGTLAALGL